MIRRFKFTLIEVMTALAVFSIFMVLTVQFFGAAQKLWTSTEKETRLSNKAALVFNTINRYVRSARTGNSPFYISNSTMAPFVVMEQQFKAGGNRWEQDPEAYSSDLSTKLIFAAASNASLHSAKSGSLYILGVVQAQDRIQLRVVSDKDTNFFAYYRADRATMLNGNTSPTPPLVGFEATQADWLGLTNDEYGSGQEGDSRVTYNLIDHVTRFKVTPYILDTSNGADPLEVVAPTSLSKTSDSPPYAILVEITMLGDDDYEHWKALCNGKTSEPEAAEEFRLKTERVFSRMIYVGKPKEAK